MTGATSVFYTPYLHDGIVLWDGLDWLPTTFTQRTLALGTIINARPYDVFAFLSSGVVTLELLAWTSDTVRATDATLQDGRYCKAGDKTRLLLGTFYTTSTTATADAETTRYLSNVYNQVQKPCGRSFSHGGASHTYASVTERNYNNSATDTAWNFVRTTTDGAFLLNAISRADAGGVGNNAVVSFRVNGANLPPILQNYNFLGLAASAFSYPVFGRVGRNDVIARQSQPVGTGTYYEATAFASLPC